MAIAQQPSSLNPVKKGRRNSSFIQQARQLHLYLGTFFAPAFLFFAITGALQTFSFHERTKGSSYEPPVLLMKLAQLHKKQTLVLPPKRPTPPSESRPVPQRENRPEPQANRPPSQPAATLLMKWFTFLMGIGLVTTTLLGVYMSFKYNRDRRLVWALLIAGALLPAVIALA